MNAGEDSSFLQPRIRYADARHNLGERGVARHARAAVGKQVPPLVIDLLDTDAGRYREIAPDESVLDETRHRERVPSFILGDKSVARNGQVAVFRKPFLILAMHAKTNI